MSVSINRTTLGNYKITVNDDDPYSNETIVIRRNTAKDGVVLITGNSVASPIHLSSLEDVEAVILAIRIVAKDVWGEG